MEGSYQRNWNRASTPSMSIKSEQVANLRSVKLSTKSIGRDKLQIPHKNVQGAVNQFEINPAVFDKERVQFFQEKGINFVAAGAKSFFVPKFDHVQGFF